MDECIFCKIVKGEIPSYTIYEDEMVKMFFDINPISKGHCLMIPKKHYDNILDIDLDILQHMNEISQKMYPILKKKLACEGITRLQNNELGQDVKHYHMHFIPRYPNDGIAIQYNCNTAINVEETYHSFMQ